MTANLFCWAFAALWWTGSQYLAAAEVAHLTDANFEHQTQASTGATTGSWFILFGSSSCASCSELKPIWEELSMDEVLYENSIVLGSVDVNESPTTAMRFGIQKIPAFLYLHKKKLYRFPADGERTGEELKDFVLSKYSHSFSEDIPAPPSAMDQIQDVLVKLSDGGMMFYAIVGLGVVMMATIGVLIVTLATGGSKKANKKD